MDIDDWFDKIWQRSVVDVTNCVYEQLFAQNGGKYGLDAAYRC